MDNKNEIMENYSMQDLMNIQGRNATLLGLTVERLNAVERRQSECESALTSYIETNNKKWAEHDDNECVNGNEAKNIYYAVHGRVAHVLKMGYDKNKNKPDKKSIDFKYYGKFCQKCWSDAKKNTPMPMDYRYTRVKDYDSVMEYIDKWLPLPGVESYKEHLDMLEAEKANT